MASGYGSLAKKAIVLLDRFSAGRQYLDEFMEDASKDLQITDALQRKFILDVVSGCIKHKKLLDVVINAFYGQNGRWLSRGDRSPFVIICYLATFSLDDLGLQRFSDIIKSLDVRNMHKFLTFLFTNLTTWIQEEWNSIYDAAYVEESWIDPLLRWRPEMDILLDQLVQISHGNQVKKSLIKYTEPQEFSLTKPKPKPLPVPEPEPELIPQQEKSKPVPKSTNKAPKEMQVIKEIKQKNHQQTMCAGHKLMGEMSLKERLALLREEQQTEQQERRERILEEKLNKKQQLLDNLDEINLHKRVLAQAAAIRKEERKAKPVMIPDETILALRKKLEEKELELKTERLKQKTERLKQTKSEKP